MSTDSLAALGVITVIFGSVVGLALIWIPLAIIVGSVLAGVIMVTTALVIVAARARKEQAEAEERAGGE